MKIIKIQDLCTISGGNTYAVSARSFGNTIGRMADTFAIVQSGVSPALTTTLGPFLESLALTSQGHTPNLLVSKNIFDALNVY